MRSNIITVRTEGENVRPTLGPHLAARPQFLLPPAPSQLMGMVIVLRWNPVITALLTVTGGQCSAERHVLWLSPFGQ